MKIKVNHYGLLFLVISILYVYLNYLGIPKNNFIFSGDQYLPFSGMEVNKYFLNLNINKDLGLIDGYGIVLNYWDSLYYKIFYLISNNIQYANKLNIFIYTYIGLILAYKGFCKWYQYLYQDKSNLPIYITLFYIFSPYTFMLSHGGVYNITNALTFSLTPLTFFYIYNLLTDTLICKSKYIKLSLLLMVQTFQFWMSFTYFIVVIIFCISQFIINKNKKIIIKRLIKLLILYLLFTSIVFFPILYQFLYNNDTINTTFSPVYGHMQGGIWYQMKMLHSWGIYTIWEPRSMYSFGKYFFSDRYNFIIIALWLTLIIGIYKIISVKNKISATILTHNKFYKFNFETPNYSVVNRNIYSLVISIFFLLLIAIFFSKGAQKPFGEIFVWLYENISIFKIFRTPDIRFGYVIILLISLLLLLISSRIPQQFIKLLIIIFLIIASWPHFSGTALRGENISGKYYDRVISIPEDYKSASNFLNKISTQYVYIVPSDDYAVFKIDNDFFVGQDIFGKLLKAPLYYGDENSSIKKLTYEKFKEVKNNINLIYDFPISHIILRNDLQKKEHLNEYQIKSIANLVFTNNTFKVYALKNNTPIINNKHNKIDNNLYYIHIDKGTKLQFLNSYDGYWKLINESTLINCEFDIKLLSKFCLKNLIVINSIVNDSLLVKPELYNDYAMQWNVVNDSYYLLYFPQIIFDLLIIYFSLFLLIYIVYRNAKRFIQ